jgi:uncharacterized membrane protein
MNGSRVIKHLFATRRAMRSTFDDRVLTAIEQAVHACESKHCGEIRFAVEGALHPNAVWKGVTAAEQAKRVFAELGVWDTELNNGVLVYVLLADRAVEIVADRGFAGRVAPEEWRAACAAMETEFRQGRYLEGATAGIEAVGQILTRHFPAAAGDRNELPDRPALL